MRSIYIFLGWLSLWSLDISPSPCHSIPSHYLLFPFIPLHFHSLTVFSHPSLPPAYTVTSYSSYFQFLVSFSQSLRQLLSITVDSLEYKEQQLPIHLSTDWEEGEGGRGSQDYFSCDVQKPQNYAYYCYCLSLILTEIKRASSSGVWTFDIL